MRLKIALIGILLASATPFAAMAADPGAAGGAATGSCDMPSSAGREDLYGNTSSREGIDKLNPQFRDRLASMMDAMSAELGGSPAIYSGYRSPERQAELWAEAAAKYPDPAERRKWVAPPGSSMHNYGLAVDMQWNGQTINAGKNPATAEAAAWMRANAARFGLAVPLGNEDWHVEPIDGRSNKQAWIDGAGMSDTCVQNYQDGPQDIPPIVLMPWGDGEMAPVGS